MCLPIITIYTAHYNNMYHNLSASKFAMAKLECNLEMGK